MTTRTWCWIAVVAIVLTLVGCDDDEGGGGGGGGCDPTMEALCFSDCQQRGHDSGHFDIFCQCICEDSECLIRHGSYACAFVDGGGSCSTDLVDAMLEAPCNLELFEDINCGPFGFTDEVDDSGCHLRYQYNCSGDTTGVTNGRVLINIDCPEMSCEQTLLLRF